MKKRVRMSMGTRVALLVFGVELLAAGCFTAAVYYFSWEQTLSAFDTALRDSANTLASLADRDPVDKGIYLELSADAKVRFMREREPDVYAILDEAGHAIRHSTSLRELPTWISNKGKSRPRDFRRGKRLYRGLVVPFRNLSDEDPGRPAIVQGLLFLGIPRHDLDEELEHLGNALLWSSLILIVVSATLAWFVARRGLLPLRRLARETALIQASSLHRRLSEMNLPGDLRPLAEAMNALLRRLELAFSREKQFAADAAHELRTPISTFKSGIQAALLSPRDPTGDRQTLEDLLEDVERVERLCESLLLIASAEGNQSDERMTLSDWGEMARSVTEEYAGTVRKEDADLTMDTAKDLPSDLSVSANDIATRQILGNLIENAIRHGGPGVGIQVRVGYTDACAQLLVEDDGPGIPEEAEIGLFNRFFRGDPTRSRRTGGTGLGLAICRALAESFGGEMRFEKRKPHGCRFVWETPAARKEDIPSAEQPGLP